MVSSGVYNYLGCRKRIPTKFKVDVWRRMLRRVNYHDIELCEFLEFGLPIDYNSNTLPTPSSRNRTRPTSLLFPDHVNTFIGTEIKEGTTLGPFLNISTFEHS